MSATTQGYLSEHTTVFTNVRSLGNFDVDGVLTVQELSANSFIGHLSANTIGAESGNTVRLQNGQSIVARSLDSGGQVYNALAVAVGDGATDDASAIQALINAVPNGATIVGPSNATFAIGSTLSVVGKRVNLRGMRFAESAILAPALWLTDADGSVLEDIVCAGSETTVTTSGTSRAAITVSSSDGVTVNGAIITGKSSGVRVTDSNRVRIRNVDVTSFVTNTTNANLCYAVHVHGSNYNSVENVSARSIGGIAVNTADGSFNRYAGLTGDILYDNGVYVSSGNYCVVDGVAATNVRGDSGIKVRGTGHRVTGSAISDAVVGITATGNGTSPDDLGYNGYGTIISGNVLSRISTAGIIVKDQDGFLPRHFVIEGNSLQSTGLAGGGNAPIIINPPAIGHRITNNVIDGYESTYGLILAGVTGSRMSSIVVTGNAVMNGGEGFRVAFTEFSTIADNTFHRLSSDGMHVRSSNSNIITGNAMAGHTLELQTANPSIGNYVSGNQATIAGTITDNFVLNTGWLSDDTAVLSNLSLYGGAVRASTYSGTSARFSGVTAVLFHGVDTSSSVSVQTVFALGTLRIGSGSQLVPSFRMLSEASLGLFRSKTSWLALSYGGFSTISGALSIRTVAASALTASAANSTVTTNEMVFTIGGASGASLAIHSGGTVYIFDSVSSAKAT